MCERGTDVSQSAHLLADVPSLLRPHPLQPIGSQFVKVALHARLERLVLPDGRRAEGAACKLTGSQHMHMRRLEECMPCIALSILAI